MNDILISIKPNWCDLIFSGEKIDEIRKSKPKDTSIPYTAYIWRTWIGGIVGKFTVRRYTFLQAWYDSDGKEHLENTAGLRHCVDDKELFNYLYHAQSLTGAYHSGWAWRIEDVVKFDKPLGLDYFGLKHPPQSWRYVSRPEIFI